MTEAAQATAKQPLAEALRAEILRLAADGDAKGGGALTADVLLRIGRVAKTGRELLVVLEAAPSSLANMVKRPNGPFGGISVGAVGDGDDEGGASAGMASPFAYTPPAENFGMTAIRELVAAAKAMNGGNSPARLVEALAIAREKGLADVARDLEAQLGVAKPALPAPARNLETLVSAGDGVTKTTVREGKP